MATTALASSASRTANAFRLTKAHLLAAFAPLAETQDLTHRNSFFERHVHPEVRWTVAGGAHSLVGTRIGPAEHSKATFEKCGKKLVGPIKFTVVSAIVDSNENRACVELRGEATRKATGAPYNNEYVWLTKWNDEGKIVEIKSYFDSAMSEELLNEPDP